MYKKCKCRTTRYFGSKKSWNAKDATCWYRGKGGQPSTMVGFQRNPGMVRIRITPRKKRVRWLDQIQAEASRPRASYTPPPTDDTSIMKFIHKKAAEQRQAKSTGWRGSPLVSKRSVLTRRPKRNNADAPVVIRPCARRNRPNEKLA